MYVDQHPERPNDDDDDDDDHDDDDDDLRNNNYGMLVIKVVYSGLSAHAGRGKLKMPLFETRLVAQQKRLTIRASLINVRCVS